MKLYLLILFVALFGATECYRKLSQYENQHLQYICGTKPIKYIRKNFAHSNGPRSIYNGVRTSGEHNPWTVQISTGTTACSGSIISPRHILSASHCVMINSTSYKANLFDSPPHCSEKDLVFNPINVPFEVRDSKGVRISQSVKEIVLFNYCVRADSMYDDFMIWELENDIVFNDYTHPICISRENIEFYNTTLIVFGFGHNNSDTENRNNQATYELRYGRLKIMGHINDNRTIILDGQDSNQVVRAGDSGGGAVIEYNNRFFILGVCHGALVGELKSAFTSVTNHYNRICAITGVCSI